jgi:glycosyltransferase involved in cell wall biosynthesis
MKVLFISQWYPNRSDLMAGLFVQKHAESVSLFCDVATLYVHPDYTINKQEIHTSTKNGFLEIIVYFPAANHSLSAKISKQFNYIKAYIAGFRAIREVWGMPDIIQANIFTRTALIAAFIKLIYNIPYAVIEHWTRYFREKTFRNRLHQLLSVYAAKHASAVMPVTHHLQKCMESHGMKNSNYQVINNVVDDIFFKKLAQPDSEKIRILNITCFDNPQKNLSGLLNVIQLLYKKRQDFEIYLVGEGVDFDNIKSLARKMKLENNVVFFTGMLTGKTLVEAYQRSHFTVLFSNYENIPVVISESLSCGLPVVSTNVGGIAEHVNESNGLLLEAKDEKGLFSSLDYMLNHYADYDKDAIMKNAKEKYSYQSVGNQLFKIYSTILKK